MKTDSAPAVFLDIGTTNARAWLVHNSQILARATAPVGVRDTAREGSNQKLRLALKTLISTVISQNNTQQPTAVIGAGMITSALGLSEVPHLSAPTGLTELAAGTRIFSFPDITPLPIKLVPGIRTGNFPSGSATSLDLMRGEETLCIGLMSRETFPVPATVLNLGSHWKAIQIDVNRRITGSITSLAGEMIHATQSATILASAVPQGKPNELDQAWIDKGVQVHREAGLPRAMFCVRLLEQTRQATPSQRMAFLIGAFIAADLDPLINSQSIQPIRSMMVIGPSPLAKAWKNALATKGISASVLNEADTEAAMIAGLSAIQTALMSDSNQNGAH